jgi:hypothetical protein
MTAPLVRLADRIRATETMAAFDPITMNDSNTLQLRRISAEIGEALRRDTPVVVGDNVAEWYYAGTDKEHWEIKEDFPVLVPPFERFWVEWCQPSVVRSEVYGIHNPEVSTFPFVGVLVDAVSPEAGVALWGYSQLRDYATLVAGARWVYRLQPIGYVRDRLGIPEAFAHVAGCYWIAVDERGSVTKFLCTALSEALAITGVPYVDLLGHEAPVFCHPCLLTISFMNLRNGTLTPAAPHAPVKFEKSWERKHPLPLVRYRTVIVDPGRTGKPSLPGPGSDRAMPFHRVRGHFVTYADEDGKRLFGKYHGTFIRPPHVRGSKEEGESIHDYKVKAPRQAS